MSVAMPVLNPARGMSVPDAATLAVGGAATEEASGPAFPTLLDQALASGDGAAQRADPAAGEATDAPGVLTQPSDPAVFLSASLGMSGPGAAGAPSPPESSAATAEAGLDVIDGTPWPMPASVAAGLPGDRGTRVAASGAAAGPAATAAEPQAATVAGGGMTSPAQPARARLAAEADLSSDTAGPSKEPAGGRPSAPLSGQGLAMISESGAGGVGASGTAPAAPVPTAATAIGVPVGRPEWAGAVGERIGWLAGQRVQVAEIQLTPAHLGPVEVRITLDRDVATIALAAAQGPVREALQASLPRLAEALASSGLQLGQASVGSESFLGRGGQERGPGSGAQDAPTLASSLSGPEVPAALLRMQPLGAALARGGIDLFA